MNNSTSYLRYLLRQETVLAVLLAVALSVLSLQSEHFLTADNLLNQVRLMTEVSLIAIAMTFVILTAGIDLSVGSIFGLVAVCLGVLWQSWGLPLPVAMSLSLVIGGIAGFLNGLIITRFRVPPLIATLATLMVYRGLAEGISQGRSVRGYPEWFLQLAQGELLSMPNQFWLLSVCIIAGSVILSRTRFGRAIYATGANETAAWFSGIDIYRTRVWIYTASGILAATAAIVFVSRVSTTRSDMGTGLELEAITAVVLGGTSIFGGHGGVIGTMLGVALMQALKSGLALAGLRGDGTIMVIGLVLIVTSFIGHFLNREES